MRTKHQVQRPTYKSFSALIVGLLILSLGTTHSVMAADGPDLAILLENTGNFIEGGSGTYTVTVSNDGNQPTNGNQVSVGIIIYGNYLEVTTVSGTGWNCDIDNLTCVRSDILNGSGDSYPQITLTVNLADETPNTIDSEAEVSGGGEPAGNVTENNISFDTAPVTQVADLTVTKSHVEDSIVVDDGFGNITTYDFAEGSQDRTYTIVAENVGDGPTDGTTVTITEVLPTGLTNGSLSGNGWICSGLTCTRSDILAAGEAYPPLTLTVDVTVGAPEELTNVVNVSGGGELNISNNSDSDLTTIQTLADLIITGYQLVDSTPEHNPLVSSPEEDEPFSISVFVKNQGGADAGGVFYRSVYINRDPSQLTITSPDGCLYNPELEDNDWGDYRKENFINSLPAGVTDETIIDIPGLPAGTYEIWLYADPLCAIQNEISEVNNAFGPIDIVIDDVIPIPTDPTTLVNSVLPTSRVPVVGSPVTIFNTVINAGNEIAAGVTLSLGTSLPGVFSYNQTNCANNSILGGTNPSVTIPPGGVACFVLTFTPSSVFPATNVQVIATALNSPPTTLLVGINTWLLRATAVLGPDVIALTTTTDFHQIACSGTKAFAVALSNVGALTNENITVRANTGSSSLPLNITIVETSPMTGVIIGDNILQGIGAGENRSVAVFVTFNGCINFDPAKNRIFIEFRDASNNVIGSTSTAVSTNR